MVSNQSDEKIGNILGTGGVIAEKPMDRRWHANFRINASPPRTADCTRKEHKPT
jgi:hypothetical protein